MKLKFITIFIFLNSLIYANDSNWTNHWIKSLDCIEAKQYNAAKNELIIVLDSMTEEELKNNHYVLMNFIYVNYNLKDFETTLDYLNRVMNEPSVSDTDMLNCGTILVATLWELGKKKEAMDAYLKFIADSALSPKCIFENNKILISNLPCFIYRTFKTNLRRVLLSRRY